MRSSFENLISDINSSKNQGHEILHSDIPPSSNFLKPRQIRIRYKLFKMKFSGATVLALLATSVAALPVDAGTSDATLARKWTCDTNGGGSHANLKQMHAQFNRRFGKSKLHMAKHQCYFVECYEHYFGVCNSAARDDWEVSGERDTVVSINPGNKSRCAIRLEPVNNPNIKYLYTRVRDVVLGGPDDVVRKC
ncbi:hypothetical protein GX50_01846 [[Emmonsia] crescens]|uniref:Uncharacterized protein n=1 Tax=[Emmonsia] crescens TaxID=73230 RepID=A0A2B7ZPZ5_9EURO|nr:hypothetical protein GX50_01846 [Emmonsia crescens]